MARLVSVKQLAESQLEHLYTVLTAINVCADVEVSDYRRIHLATLETKFYSTVQFKVHPSSLNDVVKALNSNGFHMYDIAALITTTEHVEKPQNRSDGMFRRLFPSSKDRISTLEIHNNIMGMLSFSFDHGILILLASNFAAVGLLADSAVNILAAFFVSPLMNMILAFTWALVIQDTSMQLRALKNMVCGAFLSFVMGMVIGLVVAAGTDEHSLSTNEFIESYFFGAFSVNTSQILARGPPVLPNLGCTAIISSLAGITIALGQSNSIVNALCGVTLAASLLPPIVNGGILMVLGYIHPNLTAHGGYSLHYMAAVSMAIYGVTVPVLVTFAFITFKFKHVGGRSLGMAQRETRQRFETLGCMTSFNVPAAGPTMELSTVSEKLQEPLQEK